MERDVAGGCHCGAVRFEATIDTALGIECNCSYCAKAAPLLAFTGGENFRQTAGEGAMTDYRFYKRVIAHLFCSTCGISAFGRGETPDGQKMVAINLRCIDDLDMTGVHKGNFNGAAL